MGNLSLKQKTILFLSLITSSIFYSQNLPIVGFGDHLSYCIDTYAVPGSSGLDLHWYGGIRFGDNTGNSVMQITGGKVGIGTANPTSKLDVIGTIKSYESQSLNQNINSFQLINERSGNVGENTLINRLWTFRDGTMNNWYTSRLHDGISIDVSFNTPNLDTRTWWERDPLDNIQSWGNASETYLTINKGSIGIGTINPTSKLTVAGKIESREVKVAVDAGADFVFEKDYNLPSLESVNQFIKENKHLPEIASAQEMKTEGINLSEMNIKLLQKIEELTLYVIELKKENDSMKKDIMKLKAK